MTVYEPNVLTDFECAPDAQTGVYSQIGVFRGAARMRSSPQCAAGRSAHAQFAIVRSRVCGGASRPSRLHCLFLLSAVTIFAILLIIYCAKSRLIESNLFRSVIALNRCRSQRNALVRLKCVMRGSRLQDSHQNHQNWIDSFTGYITGMSFQFKYPHLNVF